MKCVVSAQVKAKAEARMNAAQRQFAALSLSDILRDVLYAIALHLNYVARTSADEF